MRSDLSAIIPRVGWFPANVHAFSTTRTGGVSHTPYDAGNGQAGLNLGDHVGDDPKSVALNRDILNKCLPTPVNFLSQVHGMRVVDASGIVGNPAADGSFATKKGVVCAVLTADCLPVLFSNASGTVVAAAHAGWRGLASGILQETVRAMRESAGDEIFAWMGPAIGPAQFEVGSDVLEAFSQFSASECFTPGKASGKYLADIYSLAKHALAQAGVFQVIGGEHCTFSEADKFYSYRRDGTTGRMASVIWMD
ncbi:MAG: peptidoglycan editing factor PgeF [Pseudomonadota bacterium]